MKSGNIILYGLLLFGLSSCEKNEPDQPAQNCNVFTVSGNIDVPTVWEEGNVYVINGTNVTVSSVLTIKPGVIVKLKDARLDVVGGKIIAEGTAQKRIVFTSFADDRYCGDTNGDANASQPAKGDWKVIYLNGTTETKFIYVDIFYAGQNSGGYYNAVKISGANSVSFTFDNCRIANTLFNSNASFDTAAAFFGSASMSDPAVSIFTNNALYNNGKPLQLNTYYSLPQSNKFHNPQNPAEKNTHNGIYLNSSSGAQGVTANWSHTEVPYVLDEWLQVHPATTLNIAANAVVKFKKIGTGLTRHSTQNINLHQSAFLTSYKDDAHGGDTNGDGNNSTPVNGDWRGLYNVNTATYQQGSNILYAGN